MTTRPTHSRRSLRAAGAAAFVLAAGAFALAFADTPVPDPPVPAEGIDHVMIADAGTPALDCRCGALRHDLASQVDSHVREWQALHEAPGKRAQRPLQPKHLVEGVVGFPVRHFRLAADTDEGAH